MASKVLLGLLAAAAVTGSAVFYSQSSSPCPFSSPACDVSAAACCSEASELESPTCCATKSRAASSCCAGMDGATESGGDAVAALTGGMGLGR